MLVNPENPPPSPSPPKNTRLLANWPSLKHVLDPRQNSRFWFRHQRNANYYATKKLAGKRKAQRKAQSCLG
jgi:hypothetical protein